MLTLRLKYACTWLGLHTFFYDSLTTCRHAVWLFLRGSPFSAVFTRFFFSLFLYRVLSFSSSLIGSSMSAYGSHRKKGKGLRPSPFVSPSRGLP